MSTAGSARACTRARRRPRRSRRSAATPPGWTSTATWRRSSPSRRTRQRAAELVADVDVVTGRGRVVRVPAGGREPHAALRRDLGQLVGVLERDEERAAGLGQAQVPCGGGERHAPADGAGGRVDERHPVGGGERGQPGARVDRDALGPRADAHDPAGGLLGGARRGRGLLRARRERQPRRRGRSRSASPQPARARAAISVAAARRDRGGAATPRRAAQRTVAAATSVARRLMVLPTRAAARRVTSRRDERSPRPAAGSLRRSERSRASGDTIGPGRRLLLDEGSGSSRGSGPASRAGRRAWGRGRRRCGRS